MRVLVTRPPPLGERTAARLRGLGHEPLLAPLQAIRPLAAAVPPGEFAAFAVTSANGARHADPALLAGLSGVAAYAVGAESARVLAAAGFDPVVTGPGDAAALARLMASRLAPGAPVLWLAGRPRRDDLGRILQSAGHPVTIAETYEAVPALPREVEGLFRSGPADATLVFSAEAARRLGEPALAHGLAGTRAICISAAARNALPDMLREQARIAARPDEDAMIALLADL